MNYPFRMSGQTIEIYRFRVDYTEERWTETGTEEAQAVQFCPTQEEADAVSAHVGGTVTALSSAAYAWMDGLTMPDVPDTYSEAVKVYEMGQAEYLRRLHFEQTLAQEQLRADLDYVMLMGGL